MKQTLFRVIVLALFCGLFACVSAQRFFAQEAGISADRQWRLVLGEGEKVAPDILQVTGDGTDVAEWRSAPIELQRGMFYRYSVSHRGVDSSGGCLPCGIEGFSRDFSTTSNQWKDESFCFHVPSMSSVPPNFVPPVGLPLAPLRVGQWESSGTFQFRDAKLELAIPIFRELDRIPLGKMLLGEGESIRNGKYLFRSDFGGMGTNSQKPLFSSNATFNSYRWCFGDGSRVYYGFFPMGIPLTDVKLTINVCYHAQGEGVIEIATEDIGNWTEIARIDKVGTMEIDLPESLSPVEIVFFQIRGLEGSNFQVDRINFEASLPETYEEIDLHSLNVTGETLFATVKQEELSIARDEYPFFSLTENNKIRIVRYESDGEKIEKFIPLEVSRSPGEREQEFEFEGRTYSLMTQTHPLQRSDYGYVLPANRMASSGTFWWCEADWKVSRDRLPPEASPETTKPIAISAAKNDVEGFQFVIRADDDTPITGLTGSVGELKGPNGAVIPTENIELLYAYYHFVHSKTDDTGLVDYWPDALPPLNHPIDIEAGKNQPVWLNVKVPADAASGDYRGTFRLASADGKFNVTVPYTLHVWNFALPTENHIETAYGYSPGQAAQYHNARNDADRRRVNEMYLQCFSDHRISIYTPAPFDGINVKWLPNENPPRCEIDFSRFDAEMDRVMNKFHFTNFTVPGYGLGGGTFHARTEPSIEGFAADTPEYKAMIADYYAKLEAHLVEKGWINKAYIYWFDEPGQHDYEFVADGTAKIQQYGPKIQRFMTLMMDNDGFMRALDAKNTSINIWCSISNSFREELAKQRMARGERFWWYICTGPKTPYCTLFIDKPATELRVWHWQAWQRNVVGSLIWESTYWHSGTAFPDSFQNPYDDPMGYTSGYSVPSGTKVHWGNGDGRFIYPPLTAAVPGLNDGRPVFDKPVSSIRWEMIREGIEDYEMLYLLHELLQQKGDTLSQVDRAAAEELLNVPESITKSMTQFTIDPRPILEHRKAVAEMIEKLKP